jgi:hypothetical protein
MRNPSIRRTLAGLAVLTVILTGAGTATAQDTAAAAKEAGPNTGKLSFNLGVDFPTRYYFRGILQEREDYIIQPFADLTFKLYEGSGPLSALSLTLGTWNSFHGGPTGADGTATVDPKVWYEADLFATLSSTFFEDFTAAVTYTAYMSPNDSFPTIQEVSLSFGYNDAKLLGPFALNPTVLLAFETKNQADLGTHEGALIQIGVAPGLTLFDGTPYPVALSFPVAVGLSLYDYYEFGTGKDDTFGVFSAGLKASVPLKFIPAAFGSWQIRGSVVWYHFGDNLTTVNRGDRDAVVGLLGITMTY